MKRNHFLLFLRKIFGFIVEETPLTPYKHVLMQSKIKKIERIYADQSYINQQNQELAEDGLNESRTKNTNQSYLYKVMFSNRKCFNPCIKKLLIWYFFVFGAIIYFFIQTTVVLVFGEQVWNYQKNSQGMVVDDILFLTILIGDILIQFTTGYLNFGVIVLQRQRVVAHYLRYGFIWDLAVVVIQFLDFFLGSFTINYFKLVIIYKIFRIKQIDECYLRRLALRKILKTIYVIFKQIVIIFLASHSIGLLYYLIDSSLLYTPMCQQNPGFCWLDESTAYSPIISLNWSLQYFYTLYWGIGVISNIEYGDISSNNPYETSYAIVTFCLGFALYAYIVNSIINIILWSRYKSDLYKHQSMIIDSHMQEIKISRELRDDVRSYLFFLHKKDQGRNRELQKQLIEKLPDQLRLQLFKGLYSEFIVGIENVFGLKQEQSQLLFHIEEGIFTENEEILPQNLIVEKLLYLNNGEARFQCEYNGKSYQLANIDVNDSQISITGLKHNANSFCSKGLAFPLW